MLTNTFVNVRLYEYAAQLGKSVPCAPPKLASLIKEVLTMYAIIATGGKQYKVAEGDVIKVEKLAAETGSEVTFDDVILVSTDSDVKCGDAVANASVTASVVGEGKSKKVIVYKYKRKTGYHKKNGHRQAYTKVKIEKINA